MKRIVIIVLFGFLMGGCTVPQKESAYRVVTGVQVHYQRRDETIIRTYTKPASIQSILTYLRILEPFGPVNPEGSYDTNCRIVLQYSQGPDSIYYQQGQRYLQRDNGDWENIDGSHAGLLYPLLLLLPSDG